MRLHADHVAGAAFVLFGASIFALSGDLPTGQLSMPGSGFMPKLIAGLLIILGIALALRGHEGDTFASLGWSDAKHAIMVIVITAAAITLYTVAGFLITMVAMMLAFLLIIERKNPVRAAIYSVACVAVTYVTFVYGLKLPMPTGPLGF